MPSFSFRSFFSPFSARSSLSPAGSIALITTFLPASHFWIVGLLDSRYRRKTAIDILIEKRIVIRVSSMIIFYFQINFQCVSYARGLYLCQLYLKINLSENLIFLLRIVDENCNIKLREKTWRAITSNFRIFWLFKNFLNASLIFLQN